MKTILLLITAICLSACKTTEPEHVAVTASARSSITSAATATHEAQAASERSSAHIKAIKTATQSFRSDAERIHSDAKEIIRILDHP